MTAIKLLMENKYQTFKIKTRRLIIRPMKASDYKVWVRANDALLPSQNRFDGGKRASDRVTRQAFHKILRPRRVLWERDRFYMMSIFDKNSGAFIGVMNVIPHIRNIFQTAAIGYYIHNNHWRKGYGSEALNAVITFAFKTLKFHRLTAEIEIGNRRSVQMVKKIGFRREATAKRLIYDDGKWNDAYIFALTAEEWGIRRMKPEHRLSVADS